MSILAIDFGSVNTRAVLLEKVDGEYQLVARAQTRTTDSFPVEDLTVGLDRVVRELSALTGRTFTGITGTIVMPETADRVGVDMFIATASLGQPLRTAIVGLVPDVSVTSGKRAAASTYAKVVATIDLEDGRNEEERLNTLLLSHPDVVLVVGGVEGGAAESVAEMLSLVKLAVTLTDPPSRPSVIYAGNSRISAQVKDAFTGLTEIFVAPNVRPALNVEQLEGAQAQFANAFDVYKERRTRDFVNISGMTSNGVMPTAQAYSTITRYLGETRGEKVAMIDVGSAASVAALWNGHQLMTAIRPDLGISHNALSLLETVGLDAVKAWLPFTISDDELWDYAANKTLYITSIPSTMRELYLEHALLRAGARALIEAAIPSGQRPNFETIIAAGASLTNTGSAGLSAMLALDIMQPSGMSKLYADPFGLIPALGAVAAVNPEAVVQVLDESNLEPLGTAFSLSGALDHDKPAVHIKLWLPYGEQHEEVIYGGRVWFFPVPAGRNVDISARVLARGASINGKKRLRVRVTGGSAGLIVDTRGRPFVLSDSVTLRSELMPEWVAAMSGQEIVPIDPSWFTQNDASVSRRKPDASAQIKQSAGKGKGRGGKTASAQNAGRRGRGAASTPATEFDEDDDPLKALRDDTLS